MTERFVSCDGASLRVLEDGHVRAPAVLCFNAAGTNAGMWEPVIDAVAANYRVIRHDYRGTGRSSSRGDYTFERLADDGGAVLDAMGIDRAIVWGLAYGSRVAITFAARHPERTLALALFDASIDPPDPEAQKAGAAGAKQRRAEAGMQELQKDPAWFAHDDPEEAKLVFGAARREPSQEWAAHAVGVPTLVATGDHDPNLASSQRMARIIPGAQIVVLELCGHGSILQRPDLVVEVFLDFAVGQA